MSPKPASSKTDKISLFGRKYSLAQSVPWDREVICDYIADRIDAHGDNLCNAAEKVNAGARSAMFEVCAICSALRDHRNAGMGTEVSVNLDGIAGFVT